MKPLSKALLVETTCPVSVCVPSMAPRRSTRRPSNSLPLVLTAAVAVAAVAPAVPPTSLTQNAPGAFPFLPAPDPPEDDMEITQEKIDGLEADKQRFIDDGGPLLAQCVQGLELPPRNGGEVPRRGQGLLPVLHPS